ncbi:SCO4225 family membrane protein [Streptomyces exfoliatus]|uniref:SCO4225 family membrane protein n=1 Tax=Streptomyces exfoliatus TaxID=1905 RepID=UPI003C2F50EF
MSADTGFAAVWILLITAPTSMLLLLPDFTNGDSGLASAYFLAALTLSALLHSYLLGLAYRGLRGNPAQQTSTAT